MVSDALANSGPPVDDSSGKRREHRRRVLLTGRLVHSPSELTVECAIQDISRGGARVRVGPDVMLGEPLYLVDMSHGLGFRARVAWRRENRAGLIFSRYFDLSKPDGDAPKILRRLWIDYIR